MVCMKRLVFLALCAAGAGFSADLAGVQKVYLLRMSKGFDQYLANRLTTDKVFQVVTDPKLADTVITDNIGEGFEAKFKELYPPPEEEKADAEKPKDKDKDKDEEAPAGDAPLLTNKVNKLANPSASGSGFGRAKGMVFLVDAKSKQVIWSTYGLPKDSSSHQLDHTAVEVVGRIKHDLGRK
jgi:hypothetical protein